MSRSYEEIIEGESVLRTVPGGRHEEICERLHAQVSTVIAGRTTTKLLERRSIVQISAGTMLRPDLALVTAATGKAWLIAEVIGAEDHRWDTVTKKEILEGMNIPRLWMVDPRYDNVEVYHGSPYGLSLKGILAGREALTEKLLPGLQLTMKELFGVSSSGSAEETQA
jgi:hypothetical protein